MGPILNALLAWQYDINGPGMCEFTAAGACHDLPPTNTYHHFISANPNRQLSNCKHQHQQQCKQMQCHGHLDICTNEWTKSDLWHV